MNSPISSRVSGESINHLTIRQSTNQPTNQSIHPPKNISTKAHFPNRHRSPRSLRRVHKNSTWMDTLLQSRSRNRLPPLPIPERSCEYEETGIANSVPSLILPSGFPFPPVPLSNDVSYPFRREGLLLAGQLNQHLHGWKSRLGWLGSEC